MKLFHVSGFISARARTAICALVIAIFAMILAPAPASAATPTIAPDGPYPVGVRIMTLELSGSARPALVWYPAAASGERCVYNTGMKGWAILDAPPDDSAAPWPLIVFSHGMGGCAAQHIFINENLAGAGYVVIAPDHEDAQMCHIQGRPEIGAGRLTWSVLSNNFDLSGVVFDLFGGMMEDRGYDFSYRPAEIKSVIDQALAANQDPASFLHGMIDPDRIGMAGHSLGGYTTLMVGGMPFYCGEDKPPASECSLDDLALERLPNPCCFDYVRDGQPFQYRDPRVKAILVMSPAVMFPEISRAAASLEVPIMLINGGDKKFEVPWYPLQAIYNNAPAPKYLIRLDKTDHMTAADSTMHVSVARMVLPGFRSHFPEKAEAYKDYSVAFFNLYLKDDSSAAPVLEGSLNSFVQIWGEE